jgi:hypothetical protein
MTSGQAELAARVVRLLTGADYLVRARPGRT